ncbi:MAG: hypothetical protein Q4F79_01095 [Eubacteriales bacterium]|nr:hypothetical protein [Eubacteriales bacterium]
MKKYKRHRNIFLCITLFGVLLILLEVLIPSLDANLSSLGAGIFAVGLARLLILHRTRSSPERQRQYEMQQNDERLRFIGQKAIGWTFWISVYAELAVGLVCTNFPIDAYPDLKQFGTILCMFICAQMLLYVILYHVFQRKY